MKSNSEKASQICELPRRFKLPASVPRQFRVQEELGFGSFSSLVAFSDWHLVNHLKLTSNCLWQQQRGRATIVDSTDIVTLVPEESVFLLPGEYEIQFPDPEPVAEISVVPDEPLCRLLRQYWDAHGMLTEMTPTDRRIHSLWKGYRRNTEPGRRAENALRDLLVTPSDFRLIEALVSGPCRALKFEKLPRNPWGDHLAHIEIIL
jgi:hypothetical protein